MDVGPGGPGDKAIVVEATPAESVGLVLTLVWVGEAEDVVVGVLSSGLPKIPSTRPRFCSTAVLSLPEKLIYTMVKVTSGVGEAKMGLRNERS